MPARGDLSADYRWGLCFAGGPFKPSVGLSGEGLRPRLVLRVRDSYPSRKGHDQDGAIGNPIKHKLFTILLRHDGHAGAAWSNVGITCVCSMTAAKGDPKRKFGYRFLNLPRAPVGQIPAARVDVSVPVDSAE